MVRAVSAKSVGEGTISASRVVWMVAGGRVCGGGICGGQLLMLLLLREVVVPIVLLPLCVHGGVAVGTREIAIVSGCLSRLKC